MRSSRSSAWLLTACVAAAGCTGSPTPTSPDAARDAMGTDGPSGDGPPMDGPTEFMCRDKITMGLESGRHNPGQDCQQGCHDHGFYLSGTLFSSAAGGPPVVGASITFIDATGATGDMRTNLNGNFWWSLPVEFPVKIIASMCPDVRPMTMMVDSAGGGCNKSGCHSAAGGAGRIHLP